LQKILKRITAAGLYLCKPLLYTLLCCPRYCLFALLLALLLLTQEILERITTGRLYLCKPRLGFLCRCWLTLLWRRELRAAALFLFQEIPKWIATFFCDDFGSSSRRPHLIFADAL